MDWRILVFYPEPEARIKFTNLLSFMFILTLYIFVEAIYQHYKI
jgi:hypothetical protein